MADTPAQTKPKRRRRWLRRLLVLALIVAGGYFLVTQSFLTRWLVMSQIGRHAGGQASASSVILSPSGSITIKDARLRAPGVPGDAGTVFSAKRLDADFDWSSLFSGRLNVSRIDLIEPVARISQSIDDGTVNVAALAPPKATTPPKEVPRVFIRGGTIELGEHVTEPSKHAVNVPTYTPLKAIAVGGEMVESPAEQGAKVFSFHEVEGARPVPGGMSVQGRISQEGIRLTFEGLSLSTWTAQSTPSPTRELFNQLNMQGEIPRAVVTYAYSGGWEARIAVSNVAINLPVTARPDEDDNGNPLPQTEAEKNRRLRMEKVNGELAVTNKGVVGELDGLLEELPYKVQFRIDGTTLDAPFVCTLDARGFKLTQRPQIMKFAPGVARRRLDQFNNPTGIVDAKVTVTRGSPVPDKETPIEVSGVIDFRDGTAAFERFPYRFFNMTGHVTFDGNSVDLVAIDGVAPSGARIHATGVIAPPTDAAQVDLDIHITNLAIDEQLRQAMLYRRRILDALCNQARYQELLDKGLIATPAQHAAALAELARLPADQSSSARADQLRAVADRPIFELGGRAEVRVQIHRPLGMDTEWDDTETININEGGLIPEPVPYPLLADQVVIIKKDTTATLEGGVYRGLNGGQASISARADFSKIDDPNVPFVPDVTIDARDVPADALLINALPDSQQLAGGSLHRALTDLNAAGLMDCTVSLGMDTPNQPRLKVDATLKDLLVRPHAPDDPARLMLTRVNGSATITQNSLALSLNGAMGWIDGVGNLAPTSLRLSMPISARLSDLAPEPPPPSEGLKLSATAGQLDLAVPIEDLVGIFAPAPAADIGALRAKYQPAGAADAVLTMTQPPGGEYFIKVDGSSPQALEVTALAGRLGLPSATGAVTYTAGAANTHGIISAADIAGPVTFNGEPVGDLLVRGAVTTDSKNVPGSPGLTVALTNASFESPLTRSALKERGPRSLADLLEKSSVRGLYDLDLTLGAPPPPGSPDLGGTNTGSLRPRSLRMIMNGTPVEFASVSGSIDFTGTDGRLHDLRLIASDWSGTVDGSWFSSSGGSTALQTTFTLESSGLPDDLVAVFPSDLREVLADLKLTAKGPVEVSDAQLSATFSDQGDLAAFKSGGRVTLRDARLDVGVTVDNADTTLQYSVTRTTPDVPPAFEIWALLDSLTVSGVSMSNGRVRVASGAGQEVLIPLISADCHGGRIAGTATVSASENGRRSYVAQLSAGDLRFASVLSDFQTVSPHDPTQTPRAQLADESRGRLGMNLALTGFTNDPDSRRGRGTATIGGGRVVDIPLLVPLVRLSNLQLPWSERLDYAFGDFYVDGRQMIFDELSVTSRSVAVYGYGVATLPDMGLNLRFESKNRTRIPLLTSTFDFLRNELATVVVTGTLGNPQMGLAPLASASRAVGRLFRGAPTPQQRTLDQIEHRAEQDPSRSPPTGQTPIPPRE
jgi:hypothetical protein